MLGHLFRQALHVKPNSVDNCQLTVENYASLWTIKLISQKVV